MRAFVCLIAALGVGSFTGCGSQVEMAPAGGKITIAGRPMTAGQVMFAPVASPTREEPGRPAFGEIQADGTFSLSTASTDGAVIGEHRVTIYREGKVAKSQLPPGIREFDYLRLVGQRFKVQSDADNRFEIDLKAEDVNRYGEMDD